ncbi:MAG: OsmC family protein [Sulfurihydrogenibium sp.]|uniref:OsmC family protein n=1 Tax=Sulfurihydrogenibium sp. TaxID=2053621 RepID=UPI003D14ED58
MAEEKMALIELTDEGFTGKMEGKDFVLNLSNTTFNATDLMLISIGYCFGITVDAYAKHKGLNISNLKINVKGKKHETENRYEKIDIEVSFDGDLTPEQRERVIVIGKRGCTVSNSMLKAPEINVILL